MLEVQNHRCPNISLIGRDWANILDAATSHLRSSDHSALQDVAMYIRRASGALKSETDRFRELKGSL